MNKMWDIHTMRHYSDLRKEGNSDAYCTIDKFLGHYANEISQSQKKINTV